MVRKICPNRYQMGGKLKSFTLDGRRVVVGEVIDRWNDGQYEYLRLLADDERIYFLKHEEGNHWEVEKVCSY